MITGSLDAVSRAVPPRPAAAATTTGFALPTAAAPAPVRGPATAAPLAASLLLFQEQFGADRDDERARNHADSLLDALRDLQQALLGVAGPDETALARLERLAAHDPDVSDPRLRAAIRSVSLRARIALLHATDRASPPPDATGQMTL